MLRAFIVAEDTSLASSIGRVLQREYQGAQIVGVNPQNYQVGLTFVNDGQFDVMVVCHSNVRNLLAVAAATRPQMGLVLYSTHRVMDGCPPGTVWLAKPASMEAQSSAVRQAIANRAPGASVA